MSVSNGGSTAWTAVDQFSSPVVKQFTITNRGTAPLVLQPATVLWITVLNRWLELYPGQTLAPNSSATISVRLSTQANGIFTGTLQIPTNDPDSNPYVVSLSGVVRGVPKVVVNRFDGVPVANKHQRLVGESRRTTESLRTFTILNSCTSNLKVKSVTVSGGFTLQSTSVGNNFSASGTVIPAGGSATFTIRMETTTTGQKNGVIKFSTDDANNPTYQINLSGQCRQFLRLMCIRDQPKSPVEPER